MIVFSFDTLDCPEESKRYYHSVSMSFDGGFDDTIEDMIEKFSSFLRALGYAEKSIELLTMGGEYVEDEEGR